MLDQFADWILDDYNWSIENAQNQRMVYIPKDSVTNFIRQVICYSFVIFADRDRRERES